MKKKRFLTNWKTCWVIPFILFTNLAYAQGGVTPVSDGLGYIVDALEGKTGAVICTLAVILIGLLCLAHFMKWVYFILTIAGMAIIFGAPSIVSGIQALVHW